MEHTEINDNDVSMSENEDDGGGNREDEAQEASGPTAGEVIKPKRIIKNTQPKLDAIRLVGPRGIGILRSTFKDVKFKGKGYEKEDLNLLMKKLEHWAHRLFPKLTFDDTLKQIEKLGTKKPVQNLVRRIRMDMLQGDELTGENATNEITNTVEEVDVFDELLGTGPFATATNKSPSRPLPVAVMARQFTDVTISPIPVVSQSQASKMQMSTLTEEQKERIERNKHLAAERRKAKLVEQRSLEPLKDSVTGDNFSQNELSVSHSNSISKPQSSYSYNTAEGNVTRQIGESFNSSTIESSSTENYISRPDVTSDCTRIPQVIDENSELNTDSSLNNHQSEDSRNVRELNDAQQLTLDCVNVPNESSVVKQNICSEDAILALMEDD